MKLISRWFRDRKRDRMISRCKTGKVIINRKLGDEKPYWLYVVGCSKGRFKTLEEALKKIENL